MSKEINKVVPRLRFKEFKDSEKWVETPLDELGKLITGLTYSSEDVRDDGLLVLRSSNVQNGKIVLNDCVYVDPNIKGANLSEPNDILICVRNGSKALIGKNAIIPKELPTCTHGAFMTIFRSDNPKFVYQLFQSDSYNRQVSNDLGATINSINGGNLIKYKFYVPTPSEQRKIADCLSSLDDLITAQKQKLEALKAHKKGLMQQLFPAEGETVPKLRFAEFRDAWQKTKLKNLTNLLSGYAFQSEYFSSDGVKLLTPKNFTKDGYGNFTKENTKYTTENFDAKYICKEGDLLLLLTDLTPSCELLGKPILLKKENGEVLLNQRIVKIVSKGKIETRFLLYFFSTELYHRRIKNTASGSTVRHSSNTIIGDTEIWFPSNREQHKIANCLSLLDETIRLQKGKIAALKQHKKGLMQQLFPSIHIKISR